MILNSNLIAILLKVAANMAESTTATTTTTATITD